MRIKESGTAPRLVQRVSGQPAPDHVDDQARGFPFVAHRGVMSRLPLRAVAGPKRNSPRRR